MADSIPYKFYTTTINGRPAVSILPGTNTPYGYQETDFGGALNSIKSGYESDVARFKEQLDRGVIGPANQAAYDEQNYSGKIKGISDLLSKHASGKLTPTDIRQSGFLRLPNSFTDQDLQTIIGGGKVDSGYTQQIDPISGQFTYGLKTSFDEMAQPGNLTPQQVAELGKTFAANQASQQENRSFYKINSGNVGPDGKPIYDVFDQSGKHIDLPEFKQLGLNIDTIPSKFEQGFNKANASGEQPNTAGDARSLVNRYAPQAGSQYSGGSSQSSLEMQQQQQLQQQEANTFMGQLVKSWQDYISPSNQKASLADTYKQMMKDSGVQALDMELINTKNIIEGSENDIRNEITKAGGFATESQVLGLTNARNKQLIKNYNTLLETRNAKEKYLTTMIGLEQEDRRTTDKRFENMFNMGMQIADYQQKIQQNAVNRMQWLQKSIGFDGLYDSVAGDPYHASLIEKTLGLPIGGLEAAAQRDREMRKLELQKLQSEIMGDRKTVDLGDRVGILDKSGKLIYSYAKGMEPGIGGSITYNPTTGVPSVELSDKETKVVDASPEAKQLISLAALKRAAEAYKVLLGEYKGVQVRGTGRTLLESAYADLKIKWKEAANLGALTGPDMDLIMETVKPATGLGGIISSARGGGIKGITAGVDQLLGKISQEGKVNYDRLISRNNKYEYSDYVRQLGSPFLAGQKNGTQADYSDEDFRSFAKDMASKGKSLQETLKEIDSSTTIKDKDRAKRVINDFRGEFQKVSSQSPVNKLAGAVKKEAKKFAGTDAEASSGKIAGYNITRYATDPNHERRINSIRTKLEKIGNDAVSIDSYIRKVAGRSPITGNMVLRAANTFGVDPKMVMAMMEQDSSYGTKGKGARTRNPGNIGNDDTGRTITWRSWQEGVDKVAQWLSKNRV